MNLKALLISCCLIFFLNTATKAQLTVGSTTVDTMLVANQLHKPWDLTYIVDSSLWFTERNGRVSRIDLLTNQLNVILDLTDTVVEYGEGGLLGMAILNTTAITKVYLVYNYRTANNTYLERLVRFDYDSSQDTLLNQIVIQDSIPAAGNHNGSRLFILNNHIYMTTGDAGNASAAQDLNSLSGKILRFELNGGIPAGNPIPRSPIYSWGHRNPQGLYYANGKLYSSEHGPTTDDEINIIEKGRNYGWPTVKGFCDDPSEMQFCQDSNVVEPIYAWTPTIATCGIWYYTHPAIPEWQGNLLLTTLKDQRLKNLQLNATKDSVVGVTDHFVNLWGRLRAITANPYGEIFIATNSSPNKIIKIYNPTYTAIKETNLNGIPFTIYPNPINDFISISIPNHNNANNEISIYNLEGKQLKQVQSRQDSITIDVQNLPKGLYLIELKNEKGKKSSQKFVKN